MFGLLGGFQSTFPICGGVRGGQIGRPICVASTNGTITSKRSTRDGGTGAHST